MAEVNWRGKHGRINFKSIGNDSFVTRARRWNLIGFIGGLGSAWIFILVQIIERFRICRQRFKKPQREACGEEVMKEEVLALIAVAKDGVDAKFAELVAEVEALPADPQEELEQLRAQVAELQLVIADKNALIAAKDAQLADVNALAKQIDEKIPD